jgi:S1-C subfamily serine protease
MKYTLLSAALLLAAPFSIAADGPLKDKALALSTVHKDSVLFLSAVVEIEVIAGENPAKKEERKVEMLGTVIGADGLIVVPLSTLDVASTIDGRTVNTQQGPMKLSAKGTTKEVKILMTDGSEVAAKVAFKDPDLDLAFIRPEKPDGVKLIPVNIADNAPIGVLDDVIVLGRLGKDLNREPVVLTNEVISLITKPRTFAKVSVQSLGMPVFNRDGKFLGFGINRFSAKGDSDAQGPMPSNVVLPAADLVEAAAQAK